MLNWAAWWNGAADFQSSSIEFNDDFLASPLTWDEVLKAFTVLQTGGIGLEVFYHMLKTGELLPDNMSFDKWQADVTDNGFGLLPDFDEEE